MSEAFGKTLAREVEALKDHLGIGGALRMGRVRLGDDGQHKRPEVEA